MINWTKIKKHKESIKRNQEKLEIEKDFKIRERIKLKIKIEELKIKIENLN